ncbi:gag poly, partial [Fusarium albosuccineum]
MSTNRQNTPSTGSSTGNPPPAYNGGPPPSNAEMHAELQQLRDTVRRLEGQLATRADTPAPAIQQQADKDPGEIVKPPIPQPFTGQASDVVPFLTRMKGYFGLFPRRMASSTTRMLFTAPLLHDTAKAWFEPIWKDFLENEELTQDQETINIFASWDNFEVALKEAFGAPNEERQAATRLYELTQTRSCAAYSAMFRQIASRLEWDDDALMDTYYRGLKEEVKDELYKADRPETLTEYIAMAIKIDERQYERRREKAARTNKGRASNYDPYYPDRYNNNRARRNNDNGRYRNQQRQGNTSYGTQAGPMELGNIHRDNRPPMKCNYCGKPNHHEGICYKKQRDQGQNPRQQRQPLPEGRKKVHFTDRQVNTITKEWTP